MEETEERGEHLVRLNLKDGRSIDFIRKENNEINVCDGDTCVVVPHGTGKQTMDLFALLEPFGEIEEEPDGEA